MKVSAVILCTIILGGCAADTTYVNTIPAMVPRTDVSCNYVDLFGDVHVPVPELANDYKETP